MAAVYEAFWYGVSLVSSPYLLLAIAAIFLILGFILRLPHRRKVILKTVAISIIIAFLLTAAIKDIAKVPRPCVPCGNETNCNLYCENDYSFPSGHAAVSFAAVFSFLFISRKWKLLPLLILPALVSISRAALGVHTVADITGGVILGAAAAWAVHLMIKRSS